jgi:3-phosphoshikimate 1-carboxyvinyltransferase
LQADFFIFLRLHRFFMIVLAPASRSIKAEVTLPASKSISNRLLMIRFLTGEKVKISNLSEANDTRLLQELLELIHAKRGSDDPVTIDCENAGTVFRFLTALLSVMPGNWLITGSERMKQRPVAALVDALAYIGADVRYLEANGFPPLLIRGKKLKGGISVWIPGNVSSQFVTAIMMIAPVLEGGLKIEVTGEIVSEPYIRMTAELMNECGAGMQYDSGIVKIGSAPYSLSERAFNVEPDWSSAAFWYEMAGLSQKAEIFLPGLQLNSLQGDMVTAAIFRNFNVHTYEKPGGLMIVKEKGLIPGEMEFDFTSCPDLAQAVAVTCAGLNIQTKLSGLSGLKIKETDRLNALANELNRSGYKAEARNDSELIISGERTAPETEKLMIQTYGDHRMAMAFAPLSLVGGAIGIENPAVVSKSYPGFWSHLQEAGFSLKDD